MRSWRWYTFLEDSPLDKLCMYLEVAWQNYGKPGQENYMTQQGKLGWDRKIPTNALEQMCEEECEIFDSWQKLRDVAYR